MRVGFSTSTLREWIYGYGNDPASVESFRENAAHTSHFQGWTIEESQPLLDYLFAHQVRPEFTCRFRWQSGSLAFWDNRCVQHNPINDYHGFRRVMHRVTLAGDLPQ